jgi:DNA-directed RNA polymerase subunit RPC12/RpoP/anti-anti-sigma regulatory factor
MEVQKELNGTALKAKISGVIDENTNFGAQIGTNFTELSVDCQAVSRINSMGVKYWINYFTSLTGKGMKVDLLNCPPPVVDQMSLVDTFHSNCHVVSVMVPYECVHCKKEFVTVMKTSDLKKSDDLTLPELKCTSCQGKAVFSDIEEEYFAFLSYTK